MSEQIEKNKDHVIKLQIEKQNNELYIKEKLQENRRIDRMIEAYVHQNELLNKLESKKV